MALKEEPERRETAFYGRRKGHKLRARQADVFAELLPRLRIDPAMVTDPTLLFPGKVTDVWLEIGFGGGEHLLAQALANPTIGFIGCEPFINGMAKLLSEIETRGITNIRLYDNDAMDLLGVLPEKSIGRAFLLYPDPWPKRRHNKRRFVSDESLTLLGRLIRPGGVFRFASDIDHYVGWTLVRAMRSGVFQWTAKEADDWRLPWLDWPGTRYEAKAKREGRTPSYLTFERQITAS
jgi:tRNA (guanine-N7-)-methyltransferase